MKRKITGIVITAFFAASTLTPAFAAETTNVNSTAGITPDSIIYPIDRFVENLQLTFTTDDLKKAELLTDDAQERLAEAQVMDSEDKTALAEKTANDYATTIEKANDTLQNATDATNDVDKDTDESTTAVTPTTTTTSTTTDTTAVTPSTTPATTPAAGDDPRQALLEELLNKNADIQKNSIDVLAGIFDKLPQQDKDRITAVIVKQVMRAEAVRNFVEAKKAYNEGKKEVKSAEKALKEATSSGDQAKIDAAQTALTAANQKLADLKAKSDSAQEAKKNIKTAISQELAKMNITKPNDGTKVTDEAKKEVKDVKPETKVDDKESKAKEEIKNQQKKEYVKSRVEDLKNQGKENKGNKR